MMRVLQLGKFYPPHRGGMETVVETLCQGLAARGVGVEALVSADGFPSRREVCAGVPVLRAGCWCSLNSLSFCPSLAWRLWRHPAEVVNVHLPNPMADLCLLAASPRRKVVITWHSDIVRQKLARRLLDPMLRRSLRRADRVVTTWPGQQEVSETLRPWAGKCVAIPLGIDPTPFEVDDALLPPRERLLPAFDEPYFLFVGRFVWYKGLEVLLRAMALAREPFRVVLAGGGYLDWRLRDLSRSLGLAERVVFVRNPPRDALIRLLRGCRGLVLPSVSRAEVFGVVQLEAFACRRPTVNTRLPTGVPWVGRDGETSITVEPGDPGALSAALDRLAADPALAGRLGAAGRRRLEAEFTAATMVDRYLDLYRTLTA